MSTWRLRVETAERGEVELTVRGPSDMPRSALAEALSSVDVTGPLHLDGLPWTGDEPIGDSTLSTGALLTDRPQPNRSLEPGPYLVAIAGPGAGRAVRLDQRGAAVVGRGAGADLGVPDGLMSERHFQVELGDDGRATVTDLDSRNGTVRERSLIGSATIEQGDVIQAGASMFALCRLDAQATIDTLGHTATGLELQRALREQRAPLTDAPPAPKPPPEKKPSTTAWWRPLTPLVTGVGFAILFNRWQFLLIIAIVPIIYVLDNRRRKKSEQEEIDRAAEVYRDELARHVERLDELKQREVIEARTLQIGGGQASLLSRFHHQRIWERTPAHDDFATVTLGLTRQPSRYEPGSVGAVVGASEQAVAAGRGGLWACPLALPLVEDGPLGVIGPRPRAQAVLRSLVIELVTLHAPIDVQIWIFAEEAQGSAWEFARWLPHAFTEDGGARVALTDEGRLTQLGHLRRILEQRRQEPVDGGHLPLQLVVVEGVEVLNGSDLAELLRDGPAAGIQTIFTHPSIEPEGLRSVISLGTHDDECQYRSTNRPPVDQIAVSQLEVATARQAALALAPLEAYDRSNRTKELGTIRLVDLLGISHEDPGWVAEQWRAMSPRMAVPIGRTTEGTDFSIDFVAGPHGLVGGMTRSGKTEFLKTFFTSLALHNSPDDLAIVLVDFKGAVDYQLIAELPHVLDLSTNHDLPKFERTLQLLEAELTRRQAEYNRCGASTLEAYRAARTKEPSLPNLPRLLLVVDEFTELAETDVGKEQLGRLASFTRTGAAFGVHLILVTQSFDGVLPPQIEGQSGLRICFRVKTQANSRTVIGTGLAADISSKTKGRAYAQRGEGEPIEFQSARVANRAQSAGRQETLSVQFAPLRSVALDHQLELEPEVADQDQDLAWLIERVVDSWELIGRQRADGGAPAIPWPSPLPDSVDLASITTGSRPATPGGFAIAIGLADDPARQVTRALTHRIEEPVVAYAGSAGSGNHEAVVTAVTAAAVALPPDHLHVYGIDLLEAGLGALSPLPHVGAIASRDEATAKRMVSWLLEEASRRKSVLGSTGFTGFSAYWGAGRRDLPWIVVPIVGVDRLVQHGENQVSPLAAPITRLINETPGTGIQLLLSGATTFLAGRFGTAAGRRLIFKPNDPGDYPTTVPRFLRPLIDRPGRCFDTGTGLVVQVATVGGDLPRPEVISALGRQMSVGHPATAPGPKRFRRAPWPIRPAALDRALTAPTAVGSEALLLGISPETEQPVWLEPEVDGQALRVAGGPKSGRTNALAWVAAGAMERGWDVHIGLVSQRSPLSTVRSFRDRISSLDGLPQRIEDGRGAHRKRLLVIDDAHRVPDDYKWGDLLGPAREAGWVIAIAGTGDSLGRSRLTTALGSTNGVVLMPRRARDAHPYGVSEFDDGWTLNPRAGIGVAAIASEAHRIQFPLVLAE